MSLRISARPSAVSEHGMHGILVFQVKWHGGVVLCHIFMFIVAFMYEVGWYPKNTQKKWKNFPKKII
jgi:hypothetical protein